MKAFTYTNSCLHDIAGAQLVDALQSSGYKVTRGHFGGEASTQEVDKLVSLGRQSKVDFVIALGGGKTIDTAKNVADVLKLPVAVLPTTASTDAPCSALSVIYTDGGEFEKYTFDDYGVSPVQCMPQPIGPLDYRDVKFV